MSTNVLSKIYIKTSYKCISINKGVVEFNFSEPALIQWLSQTTTTSNFFEVAHTSPHIHHTNTPLWTRTRLPTRRTSIALTLILRILEYPQPQV